MSDDLREQMRKRGAPRFGDKGDTLILKAEARIGILEDALQPFSDLAPFFSQRFLDGDAVYESHRPGESARINVGDLRRARTALEGNGKS